MAIRSIHCIGQDQFERFWDNTVPPILRVPAGEAVTLHVRDASNNQIKPGAGVEAIINLDRSQIDPVHGPIAIEGARAGDVLQVNILEIEIEGWGWTANVPGVGLLADEFPEPYLHLWEFDPKGARAEFRSGIEIPLDPFVGVMGVAPAERGQHPTLPPRAVGGNMDARFLRVGTSLYLPVAVEGALFSLGDAHAAQGDGEVCGTAIETLGRITVSFALHRSHELRFPAYDVPGKLVRTVEETGYFATTGIGPDLMEASRDAVREMIAHLERERGLSPVEAYALCSVAADLKISEVVDLPNWVVSYFLPKNIFT